MIVDDFVLAVDLGGTHLRAALIDQDGTIHSRARRRTPSSAVGDDIVGAIVEVARECEEVFASGDSYKAISVVVPGSVNLAAGTVVKAPNLPALDGFPLRSALAKALGRPVILENDANAAAVGEMWRGAARGHRAIVCVTLGTGVGGGIILDGRLWRGVNDSAAEVGHMSVDPFGGVRCRCGNQGCLEVYASATAIVRMAREAQPRFPESTLQTADELTSEAVYLAGVRGDALAREVFGRMGIYLGIGLASLINILNPEMIVIAGGVANGWDLFAKKMYAEITQRAFPLPAAQVRIVRTECADDAGLLGAARLAFDYLADQS